MTGSVAKNTGTNIEWTVEGVSFNNKNPTTGVTEDCSSNLGATKVTIPGLTNEGGAQHWCIVTNTEFGTGKGDVVPHACGGTGGECTMIWNDTGGMTCYYRRTGAMNVSYTANVTPATLKFAGPTSFEKESPSSSLCAEKEEMVKMTVTLETDGSPFTGLAVS